MKVTVERSELLKSLGHVHRVVERRNTIPILANVLLHADRSKLALKATDLDVEVTDTIAAEVGPGGSTTVPAHMFFDIVRKLPEGAQIVLESSGDRAALAIRAGRSRFTLQTLPESDFPDLAPGEMTHKFTLKAADLKRLIDKTQFAISTEETRYYLNGIYLHAAGTAKAQTLRAVATDGHRLAQMELELPKGAAGMPGIIVPRKTVGEVQRLMEDGEAEVAIELSPGKIRFTVGQVILTSKLIDGTFPDYGRVIPLGQRQGARRRQEGIRGGGRSRFDGVERARPRRQTVDHRRQAAAVRDQPRFRQRHRGARSRIRSRPDRYRLQLALPARHRRADRERGGGAQARRSRLADADPGQGSARRALRADADEGLTGIRIDGSVIRSQVARAPSLDS